MSDQPRQPVVIIDDHPVIAAGMAQDPQLEVVASFATVEEYLANGPDRPAVVLLDLQLDDRTASDCPQAMGTEAIRLILDAGRGPVVIYTSIAEEMLLAACLAAGAMGAATKNAPSAVVAEVARIVAGGHMWVDPGVAGALGRYAKRQHAGVLSCQQANALRYRGQGLKQQAIAKKIGVADPDIVNRYLKAAADKLAAPDPADDPDRHPGTVYDDLAQRSGLLKLVRWKDLQPAPKNRRKPA